MTSEVNVGRGIDPRRFRDTLGHYPTGVAVVTGIGDDGAPLGMVVGSFTSVSLEPPLVAFLPRVDSSTFAELRASRTFCVNVLASDQEWMCRQFAVSGGDKFKDVGWKPAPSGAPILDGAVCWIECEWFETQTAGDHFLVLGSVIDLDVERPSLPLLFFQGGYGRFSLPSLTTADPHVIEAAMLAERIRGHVERCSAELGVECAVLAKVGDEIVTVLSANGSATGGESSVSERVPHIAPLGSVFLRDADEDEVRRWVGHLTGASEETRGIVRNHLDRVREAGYSLVLSSGAAEERRAVMAGYSSPDALPVHARQLREFMAESVDRYDPVLEGSTTYDVDSIAVLVDTPPGGPLLAVRLLDLPPRADVGTIEGWIETLSGTAAAASKRLTRP
ncbi:flavin reductase [Nocardioides sp. zg-579]|uniref:Flavin reductase n=1 Tax=Nocardioides marmotae TaxID=2663857 RepID=A0A6I3J3U4_9ACTN|nr:flavin reductase family protein [Nocardioides marmotae]MCR6030091.1 flavin reductase [Gordonia jinghuaiqii]MTB93722.1 flavin reductase [Nocardioides marmotae]QKE00066.1 flavin reductase [Nocardioides marmotae]